MDSSRIALRGCTALVAASLAVGALPVAAQTAAQPAPAKAAAASVPEQVIVTARRRAERLQKVPLAITALTGATLKQQAVTSVLDLPRVAPSLNVNVSAGGGQNQAQFTIRGQRQGDSPPSLDPSVGVYIGDIVLERPFGFSQMLFDLNNVQVLKGPQGTLFGRNTTGGAVLALPNLPGNTYQAYIHGTIGDYGEREIDGYVNLPVNDKVELRVAAQHTQRDGYIRNVTTGQEDENENESAGRVSLRLKPNDVIENVSVLNYISRDTNGTGYKLDQVFPASAAGQIYGPALAAAAAQSKSLGFYSFAGDKGYASDHVVTFANTTTLALNDSITLKNIIGYVHYHQNNFDDLDGSPLPLLAYGSSQSGDQFTEEAQVLGKYGKLNWIVGGYFFREDAAYSSYTPEELNPVLIGYQVPQLIGENDVNYSKSLFASGTYDFSDYVTGLSATFGGRYTWDNRDDRFGTVYALGFTRGQSTPLSFLEGPSPGGYCGFALSGGVIPFSAYPNCQTHLDAGFSKFTYNVDIDYSLSSDKLVYFAHRLGYRTGGFGTRAVTIFQLPIFQPETVNDYELGAKLDWHFAGMFLRTNGAIFLEDYNNIQRLVPFSLNGLTETNVQNAASATLKGAELEVLFKPVDWLTFNGFLSQVQPNYNLFVIHNPNGTTTNVTSTAPFAGFPRTTFGLTARATMPVPEQYGNVVLQANYYHQSAYITNDSAFEEVDGSVPSYGLVNLRAEWNSVFNTKLDVAGFVTNAADTHYRLATFSLQQEIGFASYLAGPPRMFGFEAAYHF